MLRKLLIKLVGIEWLADKQHDIWAHWMRWMFDQGYELLGSPGAWVMPADKHERWDRQMWTDCAELSEQEKESDRKVVREFYLNE